ncbi:hypothetical protein BDV95DRAFT_551355 [Massariosphaeria phaeospora]|uniref:Uncharacterized protein n=1 Tax=Massariosphaeria phaeospora TaxID=100035 RepID=A0A7C8I4P4_9PLEO|nr:hypothetical protein BDV95DRAFT_551355 [Massariosphaeria phaeospora]
MLGCFIPRDWRYPRAMWALMALEFPLTVANLALFGIASPNLYRTLLWAEGGRRGFNSDPTTVLYAAANYRPVDTPLVWSNFNTQYNLVVGVLCMFFYLVKSTLWLLHVFYPILSLPLHLALTALWAVSLYVQTAADKIDPDRQRNGPPWYITESCSIVQDGTLRGYCMQAKSAFAVSICMLAIYTLSLLLSAYSLYPTPTARTQHAAKRAEKEKWAAATKASPIDGDNEMSPEDQWQHMWELQQLPRTPGAMRSPTAQTPRSQAFGALQGVPVPVPGTPGAGAGQGFYVPGGVVGGGGEGGGGGGGEGLGVSSAYEEGYGYAQPHPQSQAQTEAQSQEGQQQHPYLQYTQYQSPLPPPPPPLSQPAHQEDTPHGDDAGTQGGGAQYWYGGGQEQQQVQQQQQEQQHGEAYEGMGMDKGKGTAY